MLILFGLLLLPSLCDFTETSNCKYQDKNSNRFSLLPLQAKDYWLVKDSSDKTGSTVFSMDYLFNFCQSPITKVYIVKSVKLAA